MLRVDSVPYLWVKHLNRRDGVAAAPAADGEQDLPLSDRFPGPSPRSLHVRPLLRQQEVILGLVDKISARFVRLDEEVGADGANEKLWRQERQPDVLEDDGKMLPAVGNVVAHPRHDGLVHLLLGADVQLV